MNPIIHSHGYSYEDFMCRAYRCYPNPRTGAYSGHYNAIYWTEHGFIKPSVTTAEKQITKVKAYLTKAINRFLKRKLRKDEREALLIIQDHLLSATTEADLFNAIDKALLVTRRFADYTPITKKTQQS